MSGLGLSITDVYAWVADQAGAGSVSLGDISGALLNLGLTVEAVRTMLTTVAVNVGSDPQQLARINAELNYLNTYHEQPTRNDWVIPALLVGLVVVWSISQGSR